MASPRWADLRLRILSASVLAPLALGAKVGSFTIATPEGVTVASVPVVTLKAVPVGGLWTRMSDHISLWFK